MKEGRDMAQAEMEQRAKALGANAIVGVHGAMWRCKSPYRIHDASMQ